MDIKNEPKNFNENKEEKITSDNENGLAEMQANYAKEKSSENGVQGQPNSLPLKYDIAKEWNFEKNGNLNPENFKATSHRKVWWKCEKGHEWQAVISQRTYYNTRCPYCSGKKPIVGETDLATLYPEISKEWNYEKNENLRPENISPESRRHCWWRCEKGHEWLAGVYDRTHGLGCPYCNSKKYGR